MSRSVRLCLAVVAGCLVAAPSALADAPTIVASGTAQVTPKPADRKDNASIKKAVAKAQDKAIPLAIAEAKEYAAKLAAAAGLKLGPLVSISNAQQSPYFGPVFTVGPFGGNFCRQARNVKVVKLKNGGRRRVAQPGTHKVCYIPRVAVTITATYAVAP
jgi:hypothetical protein